MKSGREELCYGKGIMVLRWGLWKLNESLYRWSIIYEIVYWDFKEDMGYKGFYFLY